MKVDQLFEVFDQTFEYQTTRTGVYYTRVEIYFTYESEEYITKVDITNDPLGELFDVRSVRKKFSEPGDLIRYLKDSGMEVGEVSFDTVKKDSGVTVLNLEQTFDVRTTTTLLATVAEILKKVESEDENLVGFDYEPSSGNRDRVYKGMFKKFQRKSPNTYSLLELMPFNLFIIIKKEVYDEILNIGKPQKDMSIS